LFNKQNAIRNLDSVISSIEKARLKLNEHHIVSLVAVSKYSNSSDIATLYQAGQRAFGENKVQDLKQKSKILQDLPIQWHFIGTLQKNKINQLIDLDVFLFHSLDSLQLAQELDKRLKNKNKTLNCLLQINSSYEQSKSGVDPKDAVKIYNTIKQEYKNIVLKGIMSIGANTTDTKIIEQSFQITKDIFTQCNGAKICSMGMSKDFELAIKYGSNLVRIGSKLFS
jgi:pyridoxal phosphate enzyme (YggS family)